MKNKNLFYSIMITMMTYTFFGICYPEFVLLPDTYSYVELENTLGINAEESSKKERNAIKDFYNILDAKSGEVVVKSRLLEKLSEKIDMEGKQSCQTEKKQQ